MQTSKLDQFLDDATHLIKQEWEKDASNEKLSQDDLDLLNDVLDAFFRSRKPETK